MFRERDSHAVYLLEKQGVTRFDVINYISHGVSKVDAGGGRSCRARAASRTTARRIRRSRTRSRASASTSRSAPREGKIDPLIGRADELERMIQVLCRRRKNNPLLVGEPGVGKTALAEGLALRIVDKARCPSRCSRREGLLARHGRAARRHAVSRRLRGAPQGRDEGADRRSEGDPVHRRDPHHRRRRRDERRHDGRGEHPQAAAVERRAALHRLDDVQGLQPGVRARPRAVAPVPEDRHRRADRRRGDRDPEGPQAALRGAPRRQVHRRGARGGGRAVARATSTARTCPTRRST